MESNTRQISVKTITGEVKVIQVGPNVPVTEFKKQVAQAFGVAVDRQRLICGGRLLKDEHLISEYVKEDGQTVHLMIRAEGSGPAPNPSSTQSGPQGGPIQIDQMIASMMSNIFPGAQLFSTGQVIVPPVPGVPRPNVPFPGNPSNPSNVSNPPNASNAPNAPNAPNPPHTNSVPGQGRNPIEIALPFDHVHNIGLIINDLNGPNSSFPPPRMPQLPVQRNPLVLLGGFLYNYQFQLQRLLPFLSRTADLMQRESLITDPSERLMLQNLGQRVGNALNELNLATSPVISLLQQIQIGNGPGQFQLRMGNVPVASEVRPEPNPNLPNPLNPPNPPNPLNSLNPAAFFGNIASNLIPGLSQMLDPRGSNLNPQGSSPGPQRPVANPQSTGVNVQEANPQNMLAQFMPMIGQMLGGGPNMTLRELLNTLQMHDEEESLPMMEFFYNLNLSEIISFASGNWEVIQRQRPAVRQSLLRIMENDTLQGRQRIVTILLDYMQRQYSIPPQFQNLLRPNFSPQDCINRIGNSWLLKIVNLVLDYQGTSFTAELKKALELMVGNYAYEMSQNLEGGLNVVLQVIQFQMQAGMARLIPPEFSGMVSGAILGILNTYVNRAFEIYNEWASSNRTQEEAKDSPQTPAASLLATWQETIDRDVALDVPSQRPFSRSYTESDIFTQPAPPPSLQQLFLRTMTEGFNAAGVSPVPSSAPAEVVTEFINHLVLNTRERLQEDQDFRSGRFQYLDIIKK